jgi:hypothetical protein
MTLQTENLLFSKPVDIFQAIESAESYTDLAKVYNQAFEFINQLEPRPSNSELHKLQSILDTFFQRKKQELKVKQAAWQSVKQFRATYQEDPLSLIDLIETPLGEELSDLVEIIEIPTNLSLAKAAADRIRTELAAKSNLN